MAVVMLPYLATNVPGNTIYHHNETCCLYWFAITPPCLGLASTPSSPTLYSVEAVPAPALPAEVGLLLQNAKTYFNPESGVQARTIKSNAVDRQTPVFWISIYEEKMCEKCDPRGQRREDGAGNEVCIANDPADLGPVDTGRWWTLARVGTMGLIVRSGGGAGILNHHTASSWCTRDT